MKKKSNIPFTRIIYILGVYLISLNISSQVTIGSPVDPNYGALLDLKENSGSKVNASKGLLLPRVKLTNMNNLYPMFESGQDTNTPNEEYAASKNEIDALHTGLIVYNTNNEICDGFIPGVYIWTLDKWTPVKYLVNIIENREKPSFNISSGNSSITWRDKETPVLHIPSGIDLRTLSQQDLTITWGPSKTSITKGSLNSAGNGPISFSTGDPGSSHWNFPAEASPVSLNFQANAIPSGNVSESNPWYSLETIVPLTVEDECDEDLPLKLVLNQTNYGLTLNQEEGLWINMLMRTDQRYHDRYYGRYILRKEADYGSFYFVIRSNARWKVSYIDRGITNEVLWYMGDLVDGGKYGQEVTDGNFFRSNHYTGQNEASIAKTKYKEFGVITFSDTVAVPRFKSIELSLIQCTGEFDDSDIPLVARETWSEIGYGSKQVLKHTDQDGKIFYSAMFGNKRWMITNLGAKTYDSKSNATGAIAVQPTNKRTEEHNNGEKNYAYPHYVKPGDPLWTPSSFDNVPDRWIQESGFLYNWYAATGRSIGDNQDIDEGHGTTGQNTYTQGICPNGWHLPTDKEWNELEKEVYNNMSSYSVYEQFDLDSIATSANPVWNDYWNTAEDYRGEKFHPDVNRYWGHHVGHGGAMKEICTTPDPSQVWMVATRGYSKPPREGGFNGMMMGWLRSVYDDNYPYGDPTEGPMVMKDTGYLGAYWASSQKSYADGWARSLNFSYAQVHRAFFFKTYLMSVRCVKD